MPEPDFFLKVGDTASPIRNTLENSAGTAVDIQGASVLFKISPLSGGTLTVAGTCTILQVGGGTTDGSLGMVSFQWPATGIPTAGWYRAEWETTFVSGSVQTFPNDGYALIQAVDDL